MLYTPSTLVALKITSAFISAARNADVVSVVNCILSGASCPCGNMNWDDSVDVIDIVAMVSIILNQND